MLVMKFIRFLNNNKGISLVETLIASGIMVILMFGFTSMVSNQQKELKSVTEILAGIDLQKNLISTLSQGTVCNYVLNNPAPQTFNSNALPYQITPTLPIYASVAGGVPGQVIAQVGQPASVYSNTMIIKSIKLDVVSGSGNTYKANWIVDFDETKSVRPHKPIVVTTIIGVDKTVPGAAKIVDCMSEQAANRYIQSCPGTQIMAGYNPDGSIKCQMSQAAVAGATCPGTQKMVGFNTDGSIKCSDVVATGGSSGGGMTCTSGHGSLGGYVCDTWSFPH